MEAKTTGSAHNSFTMAFLTTGLGVYGFATKRSVPSLLGGAAFGALYAASGVMINRGQDEYGHALALAASVGLVAMFGPKYLKTRAVIPAGVLAGAGAAEAAYEGYKTVAVWRNLQEED